MMKITKNYRKTAASQLWLEYSLTGPLRLSAAFPDTRPANIRSIFGMMTTYAKVIIILFSVFWSVDSAYIFAH